MCGHPVTPEVILDYVHERTSNFVGGLSHRCRPPLDTASAMAAAPDSAVCITGQSRSFSEVGHNVREATLLLHGSPRIAWFGVRPAEDKWEAIASMLPLTSVTTQARCWTGAQLNLTITWLHCDMRSRSHDCRASFLQQLCDMQSCEDLISSHEQQSTARGGAGGGGGAGGRGAPRQKPFHFRTVMRLRPDLFWEAGVPMPAVLAPRAVYVPGHDAQGGVNDHMAFGLRAPMRRYLTRLRHTTSRGAHAVLAAAAKRTLGAKLTGNTGEAHLQLALQADNVTVVKLTQWAYCLHSRRALAARSGFRGCIGRVRCRVPCASLVCADAGIRSGECECHNETCAAFGAGRAVASIPYEPPAMRYHRGKPVGYVEHDAYAHLKIRLYGTFGAPWQAVPRSVLPFRCLDLGTAPPPPPPPPRAGAGAFAPPPPPHDRHAPRKDESYYGESPRGVAGARQYATAAQLFHPRPCTAPAAAAAAAARPREARGTTMPGQAHDASSNPPGNPPGNDLSTGGMATSTITASPPLSTCGSCPWPRAAEGVITGGAGAPRMYGTLEELPACILDTALSRAARARPLAHGWCRAVTRRQTFAGEGAFSNGTIGLWPFFH